MEEETVTIKKSEYDDLLEDSNFLRCLRAMGVDNWEGYGIAIDHMEKESQND